MLKGLTLNCVVIFITKTVPKCLVIKNKVFWPYFGLFYIKWIYACFVFAYADSWFSHEAAQFYVHNKSPRN